ncbi:MAG TPA: DNA translocase FtsK 4TM domain-containing protein, partial [Gammaproteobacteria bacterium]|nr:DNA translocase FtsK 4TM domain-containing protein [Gammaproteobacteria bacterium]
MASTESSGKTIPSPVAHHLGRGLREAALLLLLAVAGFMLLALVTFDPADPAWSYSAPAPTVHNAGGVVGAYFADMSLYLFGYLAYLFPVLLAVAATLVYGWQRSHQGVRWSVLGVRFLGFVLTLVSGDMLAYFHFEPVTGTVPLSSGGALGTLAGDALRRACGFDGATMLALAVFLAGVTLFTGLSWIRLMDQTGRLTLRLLQGVRGRLRGWSDSREGRRARREREVVRKREKKRTSERKPPQIEPVVAEVKPSRRAEKEKQIPLFQDVAPGELPSVSLLDAPPTQEHGYSREALEAMS